MARKFIRLTDVVIGNRHRKDFGDLDRLWQSIEQWGLLQPIVVRPDNTLVAGRRRLEAFKQHGKVRIPAYVVDIEAIVHGELDENEVRLNFNALEKVAIAEAVDEYEREQARERQAEAGPAEGKGAKPSASGKLPEAVTGRASDKIARRVGWSGKTYEKAKEVVEAAAKEPEKYAELARDMKTKKVAGVHRRYKVLQQAEQIADEPPPLPEGPFRVIVADPPWTYKARAQDESHRAANPYPSMTIEEIKSYLPETLPHADSILWLWTTNAHLRESFEVIDAWGFTFKTMLTWAKHKMGTGDWLRGQTEHCLMCTRGKPTIVLTNQTTLLQAEAGAHSAKPDEFYAMVRVLCPGSRVELFTRTPHEGFVAVGLK